MLEMNKHTYAQKSEALLPKQRLLSGVLSFLETHLQVLWVQVGLVFVCGLVSSMAVLNDWVEQVLEDIVCLLIPSHTSYSHDEGVT